MNFDTKSLLAKLMATENLIVEQRSVHTAYFDVENRVLVVPILDENISPELYDLFMGHEVGHALYTPIEGMKKAKDNNDNLSIINVVEDARIEKKIKSKYPGLKNSFVRGYKELMERNFFETEGKDLNALNFIDRVNMHYKGGATLNIHFSDFEKDLIKDIDSAESYDDVVKVSRRIVEYMKAELEEMQKTPQFEISEDDSGDYDFEFDINNSEGNSSNEQEKEESTEESKKNEEASDSESEKKDNDNSEDTSEQKAEEKSNKTFSNQESFPQKESEIRSETDEAYKKNEKQLFNTDGVEYSYVNLPKFDMKSGIFDYKNLYRQYVNDGYVVEVDEFNKFRKESNKVVSYLAKEFELRKNADQLKRTSTAKTGELNLNRIYSYSFSEDLFKRIAITPNGKSHGLVMFLDWSGSMTNHIGNTVKQLLNLVMFCKKVNIPYEVYSFVDSTLPEYMYKQTPKAGDLQLYRFSLANILSSRMTPSEFVTAGGALMRMAGIGKYYRPVTPEWLSLSGTPLNEAIIAAVEIVPHFQKKNKLQVVNTVFLTDGEGSFLSYRFNKTGADDITFNRNSYKRVLGMIVRDPVTKFEEKFYERRLTKNSQTSALIKLLKKRTNSHVIGFFVTDHRSFRAQMYNFYPEVKSQFERDKILENFKKNNYSIVNGLGFDDYYVLRSKGLDTEDEEELVVKENATTRSLVSAFSKYAGGRINNRVILNRFIGLIS
jgi:flagellar biosynthesis GTPase FlhF